VVEEYRADRPYLQQVISIISLIYITPVSNLAGVIFYKA